MVNSIVYINSSNINNKEYYIFDNDNILNINTENNQNYVKDKFNIENDQYNIFQNEFENNIFIYNNIKVEDEYVLMNMARESVETLALDYLTNRGSNENTAEGSLQLADSAIPSICYALAGKE